MFLKIQLSLLLHKAKTIVTQKLDNSLQSQNNIIYKVIPRIINRTLKAIGGVRVKKIMLSLFERSPWGGTEAFYGMSKFSRVQKLLHFEVRSFGRISYKKIGKIWNLEYFTQNVSGVAIFVQFCSNLHQSLLTYVLTIWTSEFLIFWKLTILC